MIGTAKRNYRASHNPAKQHLHCPQKAGARTSIVSPGTHAANHRIRNGKPVADVKTKHKNDSNKGVNKPVIPPASISIGTSTVSRLPK